jgi:methyl-accepting chemotaxis protein
VGKTIERIDSISAGISSAVGEQRNATTEISRNVQHAALAAQDVAKNISGVSAGAQETATAVNQVLSAAGQLSEQAESLRVVVDQFLVEVRAG